MRTLILLSNFILTTLAALNATEEDRSDAVILRAVKGQDAKLPCGQGKVFLDGPASYVLWLKNDRVFLYRYPSEDSANIFNRDFMYEQYGAPCDSKFCHDETSLVITKTAERDAGLYRCRVHYQASPSVDFAIELVVVDAAGLPRIFDGSGELLKKGFVGPLALGSDLTLVCEVEDKELQTELYWKRNGGLVDHTVTSRPGLLRVDLHLRNISRRELNAHYECMAQNADVTEPFSASVVIKMYLPPLSVEIRLDNKLDFEAGIPRVVDCVVVGSVPPPTITWHLGGTIVRASVHKELHDGNYTVSSLTLAPSLSDHHSELVCRAHNLHMPKSMFTDKVTINVGFRPNCQLGREEKLGIVILETETAKCIVESYPEPLQFSWTFANSKTLYTSGVKVPDYRNRYSSSLTWAPQDNDVGMLYCRATNSLGQQKVPCAFNISLGGVPQKPVCTVRRIYPSSLKVQCVKGWDGGRPQMLHLDIVDENGMKVKNVTDKVGHFFIPNIMGGRNLTAVMYATNKRGRSQESIVYIHNLIPISDADSNYIQSEWMPYLEGLSIAVGVAFALVTIILGCRIFVAARRRLRARNVNPDIVPRDDGLFHREPDYFGDERVLSTTSITVNQVSSCQNQYSSSPATACRVLVGQHSPEPCTSSLHSYYV